MHKISMKRLVTGLVVLLALTTAKVMAVPYSEVQVSIDDNPKQTFMGFGASQPRDQQRLFSVYGPPRVYDLLHRVYIDLGMNWVRLWVHSDAQIDVGMMKSQFYAGYLNNGYLDALKSSGVKHILLAPARGELPPTEPMQIYAHKLAQFIREIYGERGVRIDVTGVANEPAGFSAEQIKDAVKYLRMELNSTGLADVGIIAPECASPDACASMAITAMEADSMTWQGLQGVATHSYNMGANQLVENLIAGTGKEYWMTEAGRGLMRPLDSNGNPIITDEQPGDTAEASTTAARFLNDMNHSVTHWLWFIGIGAYDEHPNEDSGQVLARPNDLTGGIKYNTKYYYLKQLRATFDIGTVFRGSISTQEKDMNWGYGQKPAITVAMAQNPDGTWGIGVVNTTGIANSTIAQFFPASNYTVTIKVPTRAVGLNFQSFRSNASGYVQDRIVTMDRAGNLSVDVAPHELVTLRSR
jgi:hypothetical protein